MPRRRPLTIVCHLLAEQAASGHVVGQIEVVDTGEIVNVRDIGQLVELVTRCAAVDD